MSVAQFLLQGLSLVLIDLLLAGDNALIIAMAVRQLPPRERRIGALLGSGAAVVLRVGLTFVAAKLLGIPYLKLAGGILVLWIAWRVLADCSTEPESVPAPTQLRKAIWYIVFADITMSTDNVLAIAGASKGNFGLILFGLAVSIPFVVVSSNLLATVMNRFPLTIYAGVAILAIVAGDMMLSDPFVTGALHPSDAARYAVNAVLAGALLGAGWWRKRTVKC